MPSFRLLIISFGPHGQSKAIGGTPQAMASVITSPKPSYLELSTNIELSQYLLTMSCVAGFKKQESFR